MITFGKSLGQYNLCSTERQWQLWVRTPYGNISALFDKDDEPDIQDALTDDLLDLIEARWKKYLYRSGQDADDARLAAIRQNAAELDRWLCNGRAEYHEKQAARWRQIERGLPASDKSEDAGK